MPDMRDHLMGDTFVEQLVTKRRSTMEMVGLVGVWLCGIMLVFLLLFCGFFGRGMFDLKSTASAVMGMLSPLFLLGAVGMGYLTWWLGGKFSVEYEYSLTNGELDIDKIVARRKRSRLITVKLSTVENGGKMTAAAANGRYDARIDAAAGFDDPANRYMTFRHPKTGNTLLVFTPNERTLAHMKTSIPRLVANKFFED